MGRHGTDETEGTNRAEGDGCDGNDYSAAKECGMDRNHTQLPRGGGTLLEHFHQSCSAELEIRGSAVFFAFGGVFAPAFAKGYSAASPS